jgi:hypothetical protein
MRQICFFIYLLILVFAFWYVYLLELLPLELSTTKASFYLVTFHCVVRSEVLLLFYYTSRDPIVLLINVSHLLFRFSSVKL